MKNNYIFLLGILFGFLFSQNIEAQNWTEIAKVCATERSKGANFGFSVDIHGDYAIVGAPYDFIIDERNFPVDSAGAAYIYKYDGTNWQVQQKLYLDSWERNDGFEYSVAINGEYAVIGNTSIDITVDTTVNYNQGKIYIFKNNNDVWEFHQSFTAPDGGELYLYGSSLALSDNFLAVGAKQEDWDDHREGRVYVYEKLGTVWTFKQILNPPNAHHARYFGKSISIFNDYMAIGSLSNFDANEANEMLGAGAVYIYKYNSNTWEQNQKIVANDRFQGAYFGFSVDIHGDYIIVGAPYDPRNAQGEVNPSTIDTGSAYIFKLENGTWVQIKKLLEPPMQLYNWHTQFGNAVSIYENTIAVATHQHGWNPDEQNYAAHAGAFYTDLNYTLVQHVPEKI